VRDQSAGSTHGGALASSVEMLLLRSDSVATTCAIAEALATVARVGDVIVLAGEMGTGKTAFAKGFGHALGITEPITSPTFTLVHSYRCPGKLTLHHADLYRLDRTEEVTDLALAELAEFGGIVLVEWGDVVAGTLGDHLEVRLAFDDADGGDADGGEADVGDADAVDGSEDSTRIIEISATGPSWSGRWDRVLEAMKAFR
jgi:tRNA threonylcarbamoyladenosine biosynthesis protein TsaE